MAELRSALIATARAMQPANLNRGTAGNVSCRDGDGFLITPTGLPYARLSTDDIPWMALDGSHLGRRRPSSEWRFHRDILAARDDIEPMSHALPLTNVFRDDVVKPSLPQEAVLEAAPAVDDGRFRVPRILEEA